MALAVAPACTAASDDASASDGAFADEMFDPGLHSHVLALVDDETRKGLSESLEDAGGNWGELAAAITALDGEQRAACVRLISGMPHLDRLEMTAATLVEHVEYAFRTRDEMPYEVPDEMFEPYILTYRVEEEPVDPWRRELYDAYAPVALAEGTAVAHYRANRIQKRVNGRPQPAKRRRRQFRIHQRLVQPRTFIRAATAKHP